MKFNVFLIYYLLILPLIISCKKEYKNKLDFTNSGISCVEIGDMAQCTIQRQ